MTTTPRTAHPHTRPDPPTARHRVAVTPRPAGALAGGPVPPLMPALALALLLLLAGLVVLAHTPGHTVAEPASRPVTGVNAVSYVHTAAHLTANTDTDPARVRTIRPGGDYPWPPPDMPQRYPVVYYYNPLLGALCREVPPREIPELPRGGLDCYRVSTSRR